jgi:AcrR family transcriptional regulator
MSKREQTRARLIAAAAEIVGEKGFERTSLEEVAARAGMTRGAIYGNFRDKEALFLAVAASRWQPIAPALSAGADFPAQLRVIAEAVVAAMPQRRAAAVGAASFQLYALTHEAMRAQVVAANGEIYAELAAGMRGAFDPESLPMAPEMLVRVMHALVDGLMFLHALTPELVDAAVVRAALGVLARKNDVGFGGDGTSPPAFP